MQTTDNRQTSSSSSPSLPPDSHPPSRTPSPPPSPTNAPLQPRPTRPHARVPASQPAALVAVQNIPKDIRADFGIIPISPNPSSFESRRPSYASTPTPMTPDSESRRGSLWQSIQPKWEWPSTLNASNVHVPDPLVDWNLGVWSEEESRRSSSASGSGASAAARMWGSSTLGPVTGELAPDIEDDRTANGLHASTNLSTVLNFSSYSWASNIGSSEDSRSHAHAHGVGPLDLGDHRLVKRDSTVGAGDNGE